MTFVITWITSVFITICSLEIVQFVANLAMITAVRVFRMPCVLLYKKIDMLIHQPILLRIGKTMPSVLSTEVPWLSKTSATVLTNTDLSAGE